MAWANAIRNGCALPSSWANAIRPYDDDDFNACILLASDRRLGHAIAMVIIDCIAIIEFGDGHA